MELDCTYDDSMKMYLEEVVRSGLVGTQTDGSFPLRKHPISARSSLDANAMTTVASQNLLAHEDDDEGSRFGIQKTLLAEKATYDLSAANGNVPEIDCIVAMVKETFPIKEIWSQKRMAWLTTGMIVICDSRGGEKELVLWEKQCRHLLFIGPGYMLCLRRVFMCEYQKQTVLKLLRGSELSNLGHISDLLQKPSLQRIQFHTECEMLRQYYPLFCGSFSNLTSKERTAQFSCLEPGNIVHFEARVLATRMEDKNVRNNQSFRITLSVMGFPEPAFLYLHGSCKLWKENLVANDKKAWKFFYIACCSTSESDSIELHTTVISYVRPLLDYYVNEKHILDRNDIITCYRELITRIQNNPMHRVTLRGVIAKTATCCIGLKRFVLDARCPNHLMKNVTEKCCRSQEEVGAVVSAECHFVKNPDQKLVLKISDGKLQVLDPNSLMPDLFSGEKVLTCEIRDDGTEPLVLHLVNVT